MGAPSRAYCGDGATTSLDSAEKEMKEKRRECKEGVGAREGQMIERGKVICSISLPLTILITCNPHYYITLQCGAGTLT